MATAVIGVVERTQVTMSTMSLSIMVTSAPTVRTATTMAQVSKLQKYLTTSSHSKIFIKYKGDEI